MPIEIEKEVTTESNGPVADQVSQTSTVAQVPTVGENMDHHADRKNAWVWYVVGFLDLLLLLRLVFNLIGAHSVGFASMLYSVTGLFTAPFRGIFPSPSVEGSYFDTAALVAIVIYALLGWAIVRIIDLATRPANSQKV